MFGIHSGRLAQQIGMTSVNGAVHAGLSWPFYRHHVLGTARPGDTVLLVLELGFFTRPPSLNSLTVEAAHSLGLGFFRNMSASAKAEYLKLLDFGTAWGRLWDDGVSPSGGYWRYGINADGDINLRTAVGNKQRVLNQSEAIRLDQEINGDFIAQLCTDIGDLKRRGVKVLASAPSIYLPEDRASAHDAFVSRISAIYENCGAEFVWVPAHGRQDLRRMLDTPYHLTDGGRVERTKELAQALCSETITCETD